MDRSRGWSRFGIHRCNPTAKGPTNTYPCIFGRTLIVNSLALFSPALVSLNSNILKKCVKFSTTLAIRILILRPPQFTGAAMDGPRGHFAINS